MGIYVAGCKPHCVLEQLVDFEISTWFSDFDILEIYLTLDSSTNDCHISFSVIFHV